MILERLNYNDIKKKFDVVVAVTRTVSFGVGDAVEVLFTAALPAHTIIPDTVLIKLDGTTVGTDNASGVIAGATIEAGSINYHTGALSVKFSVGNAPGNTLVLKVLYNWLPTQTKYDVLSNYFHSLGYTGSSMPDLEGQFLTANGFAHAVGTLSDRWSAYLAGEGYTGRLSDALRSWVRA